MEGIEARALKRSLCREISMGKSTQQALFDDIWCLNGGNGVAGEEFSVDDLLDLSDEQFEDVFNEEEEEEEEKDSVSVSSQDRVDDDNSNSSAGDLEAFPAVPVEEWKDLEWVSHFVDDSTSEFSLLYPAGAVKEKTGPGSENRWAWKVEPGSQRPPCFPATIPSKARSKRSRTATKAWSLRSPPSLSDSSITTSFSSSSSGTGTSSSLIQTMEFLRSLGRPPAPAKKQKRKRAPSAAASGGAAAGSPAQRRCTHCQVQKTPQWRTGPLGAKTLCNACGVRFKSGRLFPEYRPACSPTFSMDIHSNSHRKVLEIRRKNETAAEVDSGFPEMVPSC